MRAREFSPRVYFPYLFLHHHVHPPATTRAHVQQKKHTQNQYYQGDIFFNYGCFPRTWEDPEHVHPDTGFQGDNDPLDVCEIGLRIVATGDVRQVKVLGVLAMIDEGEARRTRFPLRNPCRRVPARRKAFTFFPHSGWRLFTGHPVSAGDDNLKHSQTRVLLVLSGCPAQPSGAATAAAHRLSLLHDFLRYR